MSAVLAASGERGTLFVSGGRAVVLLYMQQLEKRAC